MIVGRNLGYRLERLLRIRMIFIIYYLYNNIEWVLYYKMLTWQWEEDYNKNVSV